MLNFVFRQLLQEYFTITYLNDVSFIYTDGTPESKKVGTLSGLDGLLSSVLQEEYVDLVKGRIINRLTNITDYEGTRHSFIECVEEKIETNLKCTCLPKIEKETYCYLRKRADLVQLYNDKPVKGIILDVTTRITRTPAVIVEALLGQGEALDCYNMKLQDEATKQAALDNRLIKIAQSTLEDIADPKERAEAYKTIFGECCDSEDDSSDDA